VISDSLLVRRETRHRVRVDRRKLDEPTVVHERHEGYCVTMGRSGSVAWISEDMTTPLPVALRRLARTFPNVAPLGPTPRLGVPTAVLPRVAPVDENACRAFVEEIGEDVHRHGLKPSACLLVAELRVMDFEDSSGRSVSYPQSRYEARVGATRPGGALFSAQVGGAELSDCRGVVSALVERISVYSSQARAWEVDGRCPVVLSARSAGVFVHECVSHLMEADVESPLRSGSTVGPADFTVVDDGLEPGMAAFVPIDDEGHVGHRTTLIESGRICEVLTDARWAAHGGTVPTGNARALDFRHRPLVRATNTLVAPGDSRSSDMFSGIENGIYVDEVLDGAAGASFALTVRRARRIRHGRLGEPVLLRAVSGITLDALSAIEAVGDATEDSYSFLAGCGKQDQFPLPVGLRSPRLRFAGLMVDV
jgi:predicted Zn-dependent protease